VDLLLFVMGSVKFIYERTSEELSDGIDVGLNLVNMQDCSLVAQLVRLPNANA